MAYCTAEDIAQRLPTELLIQLTDDDGLERVDNDHLAAAIDRATAEIDARCASRYAVPLSPVPPIITALGVDLAIYYLHARLMAEIPDTWQQAHRNALALLAKISEGKVTLPGAATSAASTGGGAWFDGPPRLFGRP